MNNKYIEAMVFGMLLGDGWISERLNCGFSGDIDSLPILKNDFIKLLSDLDIQFNMKEIETHTCDDNIRLDFIFF